MEDYTTDIEAYEKLKYYIVKNGFIGRITFSLMETFDFGDGKIVIKTWNSDILGPKPLWSDVMSVYDADFPYPKNIYPIQITGNFETFTILLDYIIIRESIILNIPTFTKDLITGSIFKTMNPIPILVRPKTKLTFIILGTNNNIPGNVYLVIDTDGYITLYADVNRNNDTSLFNGISGLEGTSINYKI